MVSNDPSPSAAVRVESVTYRWACAANFLASLRSTSTRCASAGSRLLTWGEFQRGSFDCADAAARTIATATPAIVVAVGYSLSPRFQFPVPLEDGHLAGLWVQANAHNYRGDPRRLGIAGHGAGGNLAAGICAMARDRMDLTFRAQALIAPLLDPSMTRLAIASWVDDTDLSVTDCVMAYRAYLPNVLQQLHPYVAPLESRRIRRHSPTLIVNSAHDLCQSEGEAYATELIAAGVPTEASSYAETSHRSIATHAGALADVASFFARRLQPKSAIARRRLRHPNPQIHASQE